MSITEADQPCFAYLCRGQAINGSLTDSAYWARDIKPHTRSGGWCKTLQPAHSTLERMTKASTLAAALSLIALPAMAASQGSYSAGTNDRLYARTDEAAGLSLGVDNRFNRDLREVRDDRETRDGREAREGREATLARDTKESKQAQCAPNTPYTPYGPYGMNLPYGPYHPYRQHTPFTHQAAKEGDQLEHQQVGHAPQVPYVPFVGHGPYASYGGPAPYYGTVAGPYGGRHPFHAAGFGH